MDQQLYEDCSNADLKRIISGFKPKKIFLVTGKNSYKSTGAKDFIEAALDNDNFVQFSDFEVNPKIEDVEKGLAIFNRNQCDLIIAIGGGSAIDMAKCINAYQANLGIDFETLVINNSIQNKGVPFIAIPTTSGSGSEATHFAVIYINKNKYSLAHPYILPDIVCLNHRFTLSQPNYLTACVGLDALSQAIESFWSVGATEESKRYAEEAIKYLLNLDKIISNNSEEIRKVVSKGAYLAGKAINISKTTAPHAISYAFTTFYAVPHGHAVFLTLPEFLIFNYNVTEADINDVRGVNYVKASIERICQLLNVNTPEEGCEFLKAFASRIGIELSLEKLGIRDYQENILNYINIERLNNNPRKISSLQLVKLLEVV